MSLMRRRPVDLITLESLLPSAKQEIVGRSRAAFHRDFRLALCHRRRGRLVIDLDQFVPIPTSCRAANSPFRPLTQYPPTDVASAFLARFRLYYACKCRHYSTD